MKIFLTYLAVLLSISIISLGQNNGNAIIGQWSSANKDTKFEIFKQNDKYYGKIIWGTGAETKDIKNPIAQLRTREIIGMVMLNDFVFDGRDSWSKGTIYDPREGKTYSCKLTLKSPNKLNVRGFLGIALFGRTEIWTKIN